MKNTERKDFNDYVKIGTKVKVTYNKTSRIFENDIANHFSLWGMCEYLIEDDLQEFWNGELDLSQNNWISRDKEEKRLMNLCVIEFLK